MSPKKVSKHPASKSRASSNEASSNPKKSPKPSSASPSKAKSSSTTRIQGRTSSREKVPKTKKSGASSSSKEGSPSRKKRVTMKTPPETRGDAGPLEKASSAVSLGKKKSSTKLKTEGVRVSSQERISKKTKSVSDTALPTTKVSLGKVKSTSKPNIISPAPSKILTAPPIGTMERIFTQFSNRAGRVSDVEGGGSVNEGLCLKKTLIIVGVVLILIILLVTLTFVFAKPTQGTGNTTGSTSTNTSMPTTANPGPTVPRTCQPKPSTTEHQVAGEYCRCRREVHGEDCDDCCKGFGFIGFDLIQCKVECNRKPDD